MGCVLSHMGHVLSHWVTCYHIWVCSHRCSVLKAYLGRRTAYLGTSAHRPCFDLSVCLSPDSQSDCLRFFSLPQSRSIFYSHLLISPLPSLYLSFIISLPICHQDG